ncbi:DUF1826 domain-containing protein [Saccharospirillum sp. HFRX-1]|uniref:DUF1826 domain-containing protein n=1 Tax=unclassified Saccharospirillum TaxID=2633430 RepID=UPI003715FDA2
MTSASQPLPTNHSHRQPQYRRSDDILVLTDIYQDDVNLACWQAPPLDNVTLSFLDELRQTTPGVHIKTALPASQAEAILTTYFPDHPGRTKLVDWLCQCIDLFAYLFDQQRVGVRFRCLDQAMCPRFHVDNLAVRLVHTLTGPGTHWLQEDNLDRSKLGPRPAGQSDIECGLIQDEQQIQRLQAGDVALLKGSGWADSPVPALVHRSPTEDCSAGRWVLTLDLAD